MSSDTLLQTIDTLTQDVVQRDLTIKALRLTIEKLKIELTHLKRMRYGRSSEKMEAAQVQLKLLSAALAPWVPASAPAMQSSGANVVDLLTGDGFLAASKGEARRALEQGGVYVNGARAEAGATVTEADLLHGRFVVLRKGKRAYGLVDVASS